jgi:endonuclease YncB( thermonuclease family)
MRDTDSRDRQSDVHQVRVVSVKDGDTIVVSHDGSELTVRFEGIDCPESGQPFDERATQTTRELALGKTVTIRSTGKDTYGRTLARVFLPDGKELSREILARGCGWWFRKYSKDESLGQLEDDARRNRRGLWADKSPQAPWDWRSAQRNTGRVLAGDMEVVDDGVRIVSLLPNPLGVDAGHEQVTIANQGAEPMDLAGWKLVDKAGHDYPLNGIIPSGDSLVVTLASGEFSLNNNGDTVVLVDPSGIARSRVDYSESQAQPGAIVPVREMTCRTTDLMGPRGASAVGDGVSRERHFPRQRVPTGAK